MSDYTPEQVERAVLSAAGAPEKVTSVRIDPSELAALIYSIEYGTDPDSAEPGDIEDRLGMADELIEWFSERHMPVVDEAALAEFLESPTHAPMETHSRADGTCSECPWPVHQLPPAELAAAVAAYLRGESK